MSNLHTLSIFVNAVPSPPLVHERWRSTRLRDAAPILADIILDRIGSRDAGPARALEARFERLTHCSYALAMNSGTAALHSAFWAVGVAPGDEVIVPGYTFYATATPLIQLGAHPVFAEIDPRYLTLDPRDVEARITSRTRAICVVHVWGNPAPMAEFQALSRKYGVALIEDCSHAHGALYAGESVGSFGDIGVFSLQASKAVSGGEGGIAVTSSDLLYDRMLTLAHNERNLSENVTATFKTAPLSLGLKFRPHRFAMRLACASFDRLGTLNKRRAEMHRRLSEVLQETGVLEAIETPPGSTRGGFLKYVYRYRPALCGNWSREAFVKALQWEGVPIEIDQYSITSDHLGLFYHSSVFNRESSSLMPEKGRPGHSENLPITELTADSLISFPSFTDVADASFNNIQRKVLEVRAAAERLSDLRSW